MYMSLILGIDLGTTGNRVIAFDNTGNMVAKSYHEFTQQFPRAAWVEHDPEEIWHTTQQALHTVLQQIPEQTICGIGLTNQRETTVIWHRSTGKPVYPAIVWQCRRTTDRCHALSDHAHTIKRKTGLFLDPYFSATKIQWILDTIHGVRDAAECGDLAFGTIDSWILWKLTHGQIHATDVSNASRTMLFNIDTLQWDDELLDLFQIPCSLLPTVYASDHLFGTVHPNIIPSEPPIHGILGDQQAALFAHQHPEHPTLKNTYGTGLFMMAHVPHTRPQSDTLLSTIAWQRGSAVDYALEGSVFMGGSTIQWLRDGLQLIKTASESETLAHSLPSTDGVFFVPALSGLGAPHWDPDARGLIIGLTQKTTPAHLARAALESMAYQTWDVYRAIAHALPTTIFYHLSVDGGATDNRFLMQFQSDILQLDISVPMLSDITAFGIAGLVGTTIGIWTLSDFLTFKQEKERFSPLMTTNLRSQQLNGWQEALKRSKGWAHYENS